MQSNQHLAAAATVRTALAARARASRRYRSFQLATDRYKGSITMADGRTDDPNLTPGSVVCSMFVRHRDLRTPAWTRDLRTANFSRGRSLCYMYRRA